MGLADKAKNAAGKLMGQAKEKAGQATGDQGPTLPEEFRAGLDEYFNRLESNSPGQ